MSLLYYGCHSFKFYPLVFSFYSFQTYIRILRYSYSFQSSKSTLHIGNIKVLNPSTDKFFAYSKPSLGQVMMPFWFLFKTDVHLALLGFSRHHSSCPKLYSSLQKVYFFASVSVTPLWTKAITFLPHIRYTYNMNIITQSSGSIELEQTRPLCIASHALSAHQASKSIQVDTSHPHPPPFRFYLVAYTPYLLLTFLTSKFVFVAPFFPVCTFSSLLVQN